MPTRNYHEALWATLPAGLAPERFERRLRFLLSNVAPGLRVLDVGCGDGAFAAELLRAQASVLAADIAAEPLRRARLREPELELALLAQEDRWELPDACFDVVWAGEVIEHVADTAGWLSELRRVLRPGGRLLLSTPSTGPLRLLAAALSRRAFARLFEPRADHLRYYSRASLAGLISEFGFDDVSVRGAGGFPGARPCLLASARRSRF